MNISSTLLSAIDARADEFLSLWEDICNIESQTCDKAGVDAVGNYLCAVAARHGWKIDRLPQPVAGDALCLTMNPDAKGASIAVSGHMDTVHPKGLFGTPAVKIDRAANKIYGPGVLDCKGGVAACVYAMCVLEDLGFKDRPVKLLLQSDEEVSSRDSKKATIRWMCDMASDCAAFLNTEGYNAGKGVLIRKGISRYHFEVTGKAVHSSKCNQGVSAVREAAYKILELEQYKDPDGMTCSCGIISGGTAENTVPEKCFFTADFRFCNQEQMEKADAIARAVAEKSFLAGSRCEVKLASRRVAMEECDRNHALLDHMNEIYAAYGLPVLAPAKSTGGSDAADATARGIPTIDNLGTEGDGHHSIREFSYISSLADSAKRIASVIWSF